MENENNMITDEPVNIDEREGKGLLHQMNRLAGLYIMICMKLGLADGEWRCPQNEYNVMRLYQQARRDRREDKKIVISSSVYDADGKGRKIEMTKETATEIHKTWLESEPQATGANKDADEKERRRTVNRALAMHEYWMANFQNVFYSTTKRVGRHMVRICTPICSGITGAGNILSGIQRNLPAGTQIDSICNIANSKTIKDEDRAKALKAKLTGLKGCCVLEDQRSLVGNWIGRAGDIKPGSEAMIQFKMHMKFLAVSFCATGSYKNARCYPSLSLIGAAKEQGIPLKALSGPEFFRYWNAAVVGLSFYGDTAEAAAGVGKGYFLSVFDLIYEDLSVTSTLIGSEIPCRKISYENGMKKPRPSGDGTATRMNGLPIVLKYGYRPATVNAGEAGLGQIFNAPGVKVERERKDLVDEVISQVGQLLFGAGGNTANVKLEEMINEAMKMMKTEKLFVGEKFTNLLGKTLDNNPEMIKVRAPFYWGTYGLEDEESYRKRKAGESGFMGSKRVRPSGWVM